MAQKEVTKKIVMLKQHNYLMKLLQNFLTKNLLKSYPKTIHSYIPQDAMTKLETWL